MRDIFATVQGQHTSANWRLHRRALRVIATGWLVAASTLDCNAVTPELIVPACAASTEATASMLSDRFNAALQTRHPDRVSRLYAPDGALQGFASPVARSEYATLREYFLYFLQFEPIAKFEDRQVDLGCNFIIDSGNLTWTLKTGELAQPQKLPTRYRIVYEHNGSDWHIAEHIEELTIANADDAGFIVPDPQPPRAPVAITPIVPTAPAVAGFLKRSTDEPKVSSRPLVEQRRQEPARKPPATVPGPVAKPEAWSIEQADR
jgi:hypothetical protein